MPRHGSRVVGWQRGGRQVCSSKSFSCVGRWVLVAGSLMERGRASEAGLIEG